MGRRNLKDCYVIFKGGEAFLFNAHISPYSHGNRENHEPERTRKLLLHRREIEKLREQVVEKGLTVVPLRLYFKGGRVKVEIAVVRGKKLYDKRETEKAPRSGPRSGRGDEAALTGLWSESHTRDSSTTESRITASLRFLR